MTRTGIRRAIPANTHDSQLLEDLLHGDETEVWGGSTYSGQKEVLSEQARMPRIMHTRKVHGIAS